MSMYSDPIWREHIICVYIILIYAYTDTDQKSDWGFNGSVIRLSYIQKSSPKWCLSYRNVRVCFLIGVLGFNRVTVVTRCTFFRHFPGANPKTSRRWCAGLWGCECVYLKPLQHLHTRLLDLLDCLSCRKIILHDHGKSMCRYVFQNGWVYWVGLVR